MATKHLYDIGIKVDEQIVKFIPEISTRMHFEGGNKNYYFKSFNKAKKKKLNLIDKEIERLNNIRNTVESLDEDDLLDIGDTLVNNGISQPIY